LEQEVVDVKNMYKIPIQRGLGKMLISDNVAEHLSNEIS
jgi:hypothetical protein